MQTNSLVTSMTFKFLSASVQQCIVQKQTKISIVSLCIGLQDIG